MQSSAYAIFIVVLLAVPLAALAALVNINTADSAELQTLNGIGPSKAQAIIDYRTQNGAFASIDEIQNVNGIGAATYANIKDFITVSGADAQSAEASAQTPQDTSNQVSPPAQSAVQAGGTVPPLLTAHIESIASAYAGAGSTFEGGAYDSAGAPLVANVRYMWNFGDGAVAEGRYVMHTYQYPGQYSLELQVAYDYSSAAVRTRVAVAAAAVSLVAEGDGSLSVYNKAASDMDVGGWSLADQGRIFVIPADTVILPGEGVRFAAGVTGLSGTRNAVLLYPNGTRATVADVGAQSPLRGERISASPVVHTAAAAAHSDPDPEIENSNVASAAAAEQAVPMWGIFGALAVVLSIGAVGAWFAQAPATTPATLPSEEEFEIEE